MKKILIIEDNQEIKENIAEILELAGYTTLTASNGKEGVKEALESVPDLIICDIMMPELDGYGVLHILSKKEKTAAIPFIFLTAKTERTDMRRGMTLGADDYLTKPFEDTELLDAIETRLKKNDILKKEYASGVEGLQQFMADAQALHQLLDVEQNRRSRLYKKKNEIYGLGEQPHHLYFVEKGKIKTRRMNEEGKELITGLYSIGDFFGYEALLKNQQYMDSAEAMEDSDIISIPKEEFFQLLYGNRQVARKFIELLSNKVEDIEEKLLHLAYSSVRQRTAEALINLSKKFNPSEEKSYALNVSREELANMVGTATESVIRVISDFKEEGMVETLSGKIVIKNLSKLEQTKKWNFAR